MSDQTLTAAQVQAIRRRNVTTVGAPSDRDFAALAESHEALRRRLVTLEQETSCDCRIRKEK